MNSTIFRLLARAAPLAFVLVATGCAFNPFFKPQPGMSADQVLRGMGRPTQIVSIDGGERYQYSLQPYGQYATMVDFDHIGRLTQARQVLTEAEFARIQLDLWTTKDIDREFGLPARVEHVASWDGDIWQYRWRQGLNDMFYWVYFDLQGVVRRAHLGTEYEDAPGYFDGSALP